MKTTDIVEALKLEGVMVGLQVACKLLTFLNRIDPNGERTIYRVEKFKTKKYLVRVLIDEQSSPTILLKERGLLNKWGLFEKDKGTPPELMGEINSIQCTPERRKYLLTKIINLKAFW